MKKKLLVGLAIVLLVFIMSGISEAVSINPNVALSGIASQSSTHIWISEDADFFAAYRAIDDIIYSPDYTNFNHTSYTYRPWWEVNLLEEYIIDEIVIWNCNVDPEHYMFLPVQERLFPFTLSILEEDRGVAWSHSVSVFQASPLEFSVPDVVGQYVRVQLDGQNWLHMSEVQVFATPVPEPCTMSLLGTGLIGMAGVMRRKIRR